MSGLELLIGPAITAGGAYFASKHIADKQAESQRNALASLTPTAPPPLPVTGDAASEEARRRQRLDNAARSERGRAGTILSEGSAPPSKTYQNTVLG